MCHRPVPFICGAQSNLVKPAGYGISDIFTEISGGSEVLREDSFIPMNSDQSTKQSPHNLEDVECIGIMKMPQIIRNFSGPDSLQMSHDNNW